MSITNDATVWYVQLLSVNYPQLFTNAHTAHPLPITDSDSRRQLSKRICTFEPFLKRRDICAALASLAERFGKIPPLTTRSDTDDLTLPVTVKFTREQWSLFRQYENTIKRLEGIKQPPQRSDDWYRDRMKIITASDAATSINENKYERQYQFILKKCGIDDTFSDNANTYHGRKYEDVAVILYEQRFDVVLKMFGLFLHPGGKVVGASPDAICSHRKKSGGYSDRVGRMVEIKCVVQRIINTTGAIDGDICPHYYWVQVQIQLQCCMLNDCDFWQCKLVELAEDAWEREIGDGGRSVLTGVDMGMILEFAPQGPYERHEKCLFQSKHLYPPHSGMSMTELRQWADGLYEYFQHGIRADDIEKINARTRGESIDDIVPNDEMFVLRRRVYWRLDKSHCQLINIDHDWFDEAYPRMAITWEYVKYFRKHPKALKTWHAYSKSRKGMTNAIMMDAATKLMNDTTGAYRKHLQKQVDSTDIKYERAKDVIFLSMKDLADMLVDSDD